MERKNLSSCASLESNRGGSTRKGIRLYDWTANSILPIGLFFFFMFWSFVLCFRGVRCCHHKLVPSNDGNCRDHDEIGNPSTPSSGVFPPVLTGIASPTRHCDSLLVCLSSSARALSPRTVGRDMTVLGNIALACFITSPGEVWHLLPHCDRRPQHAILVRDFFSILLFLLSAATWELLPQGEETFVFVVSHVHPNPGWTNATPR